MLFASRRAPAARGRPAHGCATRSSTGPGARARQPHTLRDPPSLRPPPYLKLSAVGAADAATARRAPLLVAHEDDAGADARTGSRVVAVRGRCMTLRVCVCVWWWSVSGVGCGGGDEGAIRG